MSRVDYTNLAEVVRYAMTLGKGLTVYKDPARPNYNITHTSRKDVWGRPGCKVIVHL